MGLKQPEPSSRALATTNSHRRVLAAEAMEVDGVAEVVVTESQRVWREVRACLHNEDFDKAVQLCNTGDTIQPTYRGAPMFLLPHVSSAGRQKSITTPLVQTQQWPCTK